MNREERDNIVNEYINWARKKLNNRPEIVGKLDFKKYFHGDIVGFGEDSYRINIEPVSTKRSIAKIKEGVIYFYISEVYSEDEKHEVIGKLLSKVIASEKYDWISDKINYLNDRYFGKKINN